MAIGVRVAGARELRRSMRKAGEDVKQMTAVHKRISAIATEQARELAPVASGKLARGIRGTGSAGKAAVRINPRAVVYGGVQEYGWGRRNIPAKRFIRKAVKETQPQWLKVYEKAVTEIVQRIKGVPPTSGE